MTVREFREAERDHIKKTLAKHNVISISRWATDRHLKQIERLLHFARQDREGEGVEPTYLVTALESVYAERTKLAKEES